jgi:undecaprenyl-diphosphatase
MRVFWGIAVAVVAVLSGLTWKFDWGRSKDLACFHKINNPQLWDGLDQFLILTRVLGTKWVLIIFLGLVFLWRSQAGVSITIAAILATAIERGIKIIVKRPRPFQDHEITFIHQNPAPRDPGFPSGDATRAWFMLAAIVIGFQPALIWSLIAGLSTAVVSFGRVRLGVHYPLDVWAGAGLGFGLGVAWSNFMV